MNRARPTTHGTPERTGPDVIPPCDTEGGRLTPLPDGLGLSVHLTAPAPLVRLTELLTQACHRAEERRTPTTVVLHLGGAPGDRSWPGAVGIHDVNRWERALRRLERLAAVTVAVARGTCTGPALDLLLAGDYRIADSALRLLLPVNDGHFWPGTAVHRLAVQLGVARARRLVLWGHELSAAEALDLGVIDTVDDDLDAAVRAATVLRGRIAGTELAVRRQLLLEAPATSHEDALGAHLAACDRELRRLRRTGHAATPVREGRTP
uniref:DpgB n=1 Tax=Streptomyces roseoverticillatus TaxID=66429 RepID=A0A0S3TVU4_9ACTN|nr:DpgB [Streptomyces roseoverticillatus]